MPRSPVDLLTPSQLEAIEALGGHTNRDISRVLGVSLSTAKAQGFEDRPAVVAVGDGLVEDLINGLGPTR